MAKVIRIDTDVFKALQSKASELGIPFTSPNNIIRLVLGLKPLDTQRHKPK